MSSKDQGNDRDLEPKVPTEHPDPKAAARGGGPGSEDRPGFDLGGAADTSGATGNVIPGGPRGDPASGNSATGRAGGLTDVSGTRSLGNEGGEAGSASGGGAPSGSGGPT